MIAFIMQLFVAAVTSALGTFGMLLPGDTKDTTLFFHFTEDHYVAVAELDAATKTARSDTRLFHVAERTNLVRAARGAGEIYVVVGSQNDDDAPVMLARVTGKKLAAAPIEIGHGSVPNVAARADSKYVVTTFFEDRPPNEPMRGSMLRPPTHVMHVQARDAATLALAGFRTVRDRDEKLIDTGVVAAPLAVTKNTDMVSPDRVALDLPARGKRRHVVAALPLLAIVDDRTGPSIGDRENDVDDAVVYIDGEQNQP